MDKGIKIEFLGLGIMAFAYFWALFDGTKDYNFMVTAAGLFMSICFLEVYLKNKIDKKVINNG